MADFPAIAMDNVMQTAWARVAKNAAILTTLKVVMPTLSLALVLAVSRLLGAEGLGRYTLVFTLLQLCTMLTPLGLDAFLTREGVRHPDGLPVLLGNAAPLAGASSLLAMGVIVALGNVPGYDQATRSALMVLSLAVLPTTMLAFFEAVFVAHERFEYIAASSLLELVIKVGGAVPLLLLGYGVTAVVAMFVSGNLLACLLAWRLAARLRVRLQWRLDRAVLRQLLQAAPTFLCIAVLATLYWRIDAIMLSLLGDLAEVGYYGATYRLMELALILPTSLCRALYPRITHMAHSAPERLPQLGGMTLRYLWVLMLPLAGGLTVIGGPIMTLLYGETFRHAAATLAVLIWTILPFAWVRYHAYILVAADHQQIDLRLNIIMSSVNVLCNLVLIPRYGALGAAVATCMSMCLYALGQYVYLRRYLPRHMAQWPDLWYPVLGTLVMSLGLWWCRTVPLALAIPMAAAVYVGVLLASRYFAAEELEALRLNHLIAKIGLGS